MIDILKESIAEVSQRNGRKAWHLPLDVEQYHADMTHDSKSSLMMFDKSPSLYYGTRVSKRWTLPQTEPQRLGNVAGMAILEPEAFAQKALVIPAEVLAKNGAKSTNAYKDFAAANSERLLLTQDELDATRWQADAVRENKAARELLERAAVTEHSVFWIDRDGNRLKARFDLASELDAIVSDLKTCAKPDKAGFFRSVREYGYHRQAALYQDGFAAMYGQRPQFRFIVVGSEPPYDCFVYELPRDYVQVGRTLNKSTLERLAACRAGVSPWKPEGFGKINLIDVPAYEYPTLDDYPEA